MIYTSFDNVGFVKVLSFLKSHKSEYLSGQDLSDVLKISRVAIWKHIKKIESLGYKIESKQKLGYKLIGNSKLFLPWEITEGIKTKFIGKRVYYFDEIDSTQNFATSIANKENENGTVIIAKKQTSGKGRLGRKWISPKGGIWFSVILHPKFDVSLATLFPLASSLALAKSIEKILDKRVQLKWPNDVTLNQKKVAGMLVDLSLESNKIQNLVLGVGINYEINPKGVEKLLKMKPNFYGVTTLIKKDQISNPIKLIQEFFFELENICTELNQGDVKKIIKEWTKRSLTIGKKARVLTSEGHISGKALRIDNDGALIITQARKSHRVIVGDVS